MSNIYAYSFLNEPVCVMFYDTSLWKYFWFRTPWWWRLIFKCFLYHFLHLLKVGKLRFFDIHVNFRRIEINQSFDGTLLEFVNLFINFVDTTIRFFYFLCYWFKIHLNGLQDGAFDGFHFINDWLFVLFMFFGKSLKFLNGHFGGFFIW